MEILDDIYPEAIFPTLPDSDERDPGPRIVSLCRHLDAARGRIQELEDLRDWLTERLQQ
jgi:hypothetical protein